MSSRIAYFISEFPARSHTFIRREIAALREQGAEIEIFAIRKPAANALLDAADQSDAKETTAILPATVSQVLLAHWFFLARNPYRYLQTFYAAITHRLPGLKNLIWSVFYFVEAGLLAQSLVSRNHHHLHVHFAISCANVARLAARLADISWSITLHGACDFEYPNGPLLRQKIEEASFTCCISRYGMSQAMRQMDYPHWNKLHLVRCGIDPGRLPPARADSIDSIKKLICVGRLSPEKGQLGLVHVFANLVKRHPELHLTLVGDGDDRKQVEALIAKLAIANKVTLTGALPEHETLKNIAASDLLIIPSFMEGIPVALMEALSLNVPGIAPRVAGIPELIEENVSGLLFTPAHWDDLEQKIERLIQHPDLAQKLTQHGKVVVSKEFYLPTCVSPLLAQFDALNQSGNPAKQAISPSAQ